MRHRAITLLWITLYTFLLAPLSPLWAQSAVPAAEPIAPPRVQHEPFDQAVVAGAPLLIEAMIAAEASVDAVLLYRRIGGSSYTHISMRNQGEGRFTAKIPEKEVVPPGIEYFIQATDAFGNMTTYGQPLPPGAFKLVPLTALVQPLAPPVDPAFSDRIFSSEPQRTAEKTSAGNPWYKKWWVWAIVGSVAAAGAAIASKGGHGGESGNTGGGAPSTGSLTISGPVPRTP